MRDAVESAGVPGEPDPVPDEAPEEEPGTVTV